jgi:hypothetical protein
LLFSRGFCGVFFAGFLNPKTLATIGVLIVSADFLANRLSNWIETDPFFCLRRGLSAPQSHHLVHELGTIDEADWAIEFK